MSRPGPVRTIRLIRAGSEVGHAVGIAARGAAWLPARHRRVA